MNIGYAFSYFSSAVVDGNISSYLDQVGSGAQKSEKMLWAAATRHGLKITGINVSFSFVG